MFAKILVGTDGSDSATVAVEHAVALGELLGSEVTIAAAHASAGAGARAGARANLSRGSGTTITREVALALLRDARTAYDGRVRLSTREIHGPAARALVALAQEEGFDLLVVGNRRGGEGSRHGSVAQGVAQHLSAAVLVVDSVGGADPGFRRLAVLVGDDRTHADRPSVDARELVRLADGVASALGAHLTVVACSRSGRAAHARLPALLAAVPGAAGSAFAGPPDAWVFQAGPSDGYDLLVVAHRGRAGVGRSVAGEADRLSRRAGTSVLLVPGVADERGAEHAGRPRTGKESQMARGGPEALSDVPLFAGLSKRHLRHIAGLSEEKRFDEGAKLAEEGQSGDVFYVLLEGEAKVVRGGRRVAKLIPGDFFGEIALIDGGPRTATVVATTPLAALAITRKRFRSMLEEDPNITLAMLEELTRRLRNNERSATG